MEFILIISGWRELSRREQNEEEEICMAGIRGANESLFGISSANKHAPFVPHVDKVTLAFSRKPPLRINLIL